MSKIKLLLNVVSDLRSLADSVQAVAEAMAGNEPAEANQPEAVKLETPAATKEGKPASKAITLEQIRAVLAEKSHDGFTAQVRELLEKHGAKKLSDIDPTHYAALLKDAEGLK